MTYSIVLFFIILFIMLNLNDGFLMTLIALEYLLVLILHIYLFSQMNMGNDWLFILILIMGVSQSIMGLSLMISLVFMSGNESVKMLNLSW